MRTHMMLWTLVLASVLLLPLTPAVFAEPEQQAAAPAAQVAPSADTFGGPYGTTFAPGN